MVKILSIPIGILVLFLAYTIHSHDLSILEMKEYNHLVTLYTRTQCIYCEKAVELLIAKKMHFKKIDITSDQNQWNQLKNDTGASTVPYIFIDGRYIGGCTDLLALDSSGKLDEMLK